MELLMSSSRLDLSERYRLHALYETGMSMRAIASALERAPSTRSAANCNAMQRNQHARQSWKGRGGQHDRTSQSPASAGLLA
ncbi:hypothetical protein O1K_06082 [Xanthomonas fragariae LMG 25863]|nr:hypothetical protein O1K_06082 [Xanthomonas fragariae LMG 25863]